MLLPLHDEVKELSSVVMKVLLGSETLQLRSENDAYYLLCAWLSQAQCIPDEPERQTLFKQLVLQLRFHHMSPDFLCAVISVCPYANASGLIPYIMRCSQALRIPPPARTKAKGLKWGFDDRSKGHPEYTTISLRSFRYLENYPLMQRVSTCTLVWRRASRWQCT